MYRLLLGLSNPAMHRAFCSYCLYCGACQLCCPVPLQRTPHEPCAVNSYQMSASKNSLLRPCSMHLSAVGPVSRSVLSSSRGGAVLSSSSIMNAWLPSVHTTPSRTCLLESCHGGSSTRSQSREQRQLLLGVRAGTPIICYSTAFRPFKW